MALNHEDRITKLEIQLAHTQRLVEQLNEVITEQGKNLDRINRVIVRFEQKLDDFKYKVEDKRDLLDEKPPHY
ncbi:SlyX family protein [bacterium]|nr:SlyX family protein [Rhodopirellula sp.]MDB4679024.1 SlyX family protein [Rhodopirellula sp.]MDC0278858.1 SlyX family protein [bacterium]